MKRIVLILCLLLPFLTLKAQETYTINGETLELKTEVSGNLDLLWTANTRKSRYFVRTTDGSIIELVDTKNSETGKNQQEYITTLNGLTQEYGLTAEKVKFTFPSLKNYINVYNSTSDLSYNFEPQSKLKLRLGAFGGFTNQPFISNPSNTLVPSFGAELEIYSDGKFKRHAGYFSLRTALDSDDINYSATQLALGYRFRFIDKETFSVYANATFATYTFYNEVLVYEDPENPGSYLTLEQSGSGFNAPFSFGLGSDIKVSKNGYITLAYNSLFAIFSENQGNFPVDFAVGFKFNL
ncbi:hypothetical protein [Bizionia arctica]|uniref:Outer membrane protein beta-barrel domain-containing protein n=1 Tax=Bizionia arctica TaxID=1495645 RepID=A0A917GDW6_9FLAO|nr:hypothetical protein [Bizionia arctica]GGG39858.1 hypothetical protein GCM10010976_09370 [Bizionia arctica]